MIYIPDINQVWAGTVENCIRSYNAEVSKHNHIPSEYMNTISYITFYPFPSHIQQTGDPIQEVNLNYTSTPSSTAINNNNNDPFLIHNTNNWIHCLLAFNPPPNDASTNTHNTGGQVWSAGGDKVIRVWDKVDI